MHNNIGDDYSALSKKEQKGFGYMTKNIFRKF